MEQTEARFNILFIDDDEVDIENVRREIKKASLPVRLHTARDGIDAMNKLCGTNGEEKMPLPSLILLDINMPRMGGIEFLRDLQKHSQLRNITVYFLTTAFTTHDKTATKNLPVAGHIIKPLLHDDLMKIYWTMIEGGKV